MRLAKSTTVYDLPRHLRQEEPRTISVVNGSLPGPEESILRCLQRTEAKNGRATVQGLRCADFSELHPDEPDVPGAPQPVPHWPAHVPGPFLEGASYLSLICGHLEDDRSCLSVSVMAGR